MATQVKKVLSKQDYYCKDCNKKIHSTTALYGKGRCHSCAKKGKKNHRYIDGAFLKKYFCIDCRKQITTSTGIYGNKRCFFCANKGRNNPNWKNGISKIGYSFNFNKQLKNKIRKRDNHTCQICRIKQENCYRQLDVHHIDYDKDNLNSKNLISLCQSCHIKTNYNRKYWKNLLKNRRIK